MAEPYVGEIRLVGFNFQPNGWAFCNGQLLSIAENEVLFNLIGTTYGGDGVNTFALPNLASRVPIHQGVDSFGQSYVLGEILGEETVTLSLSQIPPHNHTVPVNSAVGTSSSSSHSNLAAAPLALGNTYSTNSPSGSMPSSAISSTGGSQPHDNMQPFLVCNYVISLFGIFPSQN